MLAAVVQGTSLGHATKREKRYHPLKTEQTSGVGLLYEKKNKKKTPVNTRVALIYYGEASARPIKKTQYHI